MSSFNPPQTSPAPPLRPLELDPSTTSPQHQSPLYSTIPPELRNRIFAYALSPYSDPTQAYDADTPYARPSHPAPPRHSTTLLRTCRRVYAEAWFLPWATSTHTFYLGHQERRPAHGTSTPQLLQPALNTLHALHPAGPVYLSDIHIFAQLFALESGNDLSRILRLDHFHPRCITITLRHTDWWFWEEDAVLKIDGRWVGYCEGMWPESVGEVRLELESLERRKEQIDDVAVQMAERWGFGRRDGVMLCVEGRDGGSMLRRAAVGSAPDDEDDDDDHENAEAKDDHDHMNAEENDEEPDTNKHIPGTVTRWTGSSILNGSRWLRDETPDAAPGTLSYYVRTLSFVPQPLPPQTTNSHAEPHTTQTIDEPTPPTAPTNDTNDADESNIASDTDTSSDSDSYNSDSDIGRPTPHYPRITTRIGRPLHSTPHTAPAAYEEQHDILAAGCTPSMTADAIRERLAMWRAEEFEAAQVAARDERAVRLRAEVEAGRGLIGAGGAGGAARGGGGGGGERGGERGGVDEEYRVRVLGRFDSSEDEDGDGDGEEGEGEEEGGSGDEGPMQPVQQVPEPRRLGRGGAGRGRIAGGPPL